MSNRDFLLEIGLEEMPARFVTDAMNQLKDSLSKWLDDNRLPFSSIEAFSTPRRLAIRVNELTEKQPDITEEAKGPAKNIAMDENGEWTKAARGFAKGQNINVDDLYVKEVKGTEYVFANKEIKGKTAAELLTGMESLITHLHFPKNMRWGSYSLKYVRPIHWIVALFGEEVIQIDITDVKSGRQSYGHRFLGSAADLTAPANYEEQLLNQYVVVRPDERKQMIRQQIEEVASQKNWHVKVEEELLEEVNNLVEYPTVFYGAFDEEFLRIPEEVLITSMREHQRYFPVADTSGTLLPYFIGVRNGNEAHLDNVRKGNEKVLRARLSDADFFYQEDQQLKLDDAVEKLNHIVFQEELGTIGDKVRRLTEVAPDFADKLNLDEKEKQDVKRAAYLSKFDLVTLMVDEFSELQGIMGEKYARMAGENETVAAAIKEHYQPRHAKDHVPQSVTGAVLALAEKLDTIAACFSIGLIPTGSQDPHGLRRQAAGIVHILFEHNVYASLKELIKTSLDCLENAGILSRNKSEVMTDMLAFFELRLKNILSERKVRYDVGDAVLENVGEPVVLTVKKAEFLQQKLADEHFKETVEALSRVTNIAKKQANFSNRIDTDLFQEPKERQLYDAYAALQKELPQKLTEVDVRGAFALLDELQGTINEYFDHVMVMSDDKQVKENRLAQMKQLSVEIHRFADFQQIVFSS
ncbi:glycyl-tRNA synthetase beta chain [Alteribacillus persepolensis]|uniref:Glycine--tRNA ligase beta subunit n=1 Tax=Alteribacillus persepolensis TaxID=568899 RepID=A0A1G8CRR0_9BACI|nr:glycine--tRNA ligase subunit beta [Alteribacillus persepolensis]SDH48112.1 glycyl-tRNA synthetase beta chain [Alteribacillus persepolensis]